MLAQPFTKKTLIVVLILIAALITVSFVAYSSPAASAPEVDRSYDGIEELRLGDPIDTRLSNVSDEMIENVRLTRSVADRSYDQLEAVRLDRFGSWDTSYDLVENVRVERTLSNFAADYSYDGIEQLRAGRTLQADRSYDAIENIRLARMIK